MDDAPHGLVRTLTVLFVVMFATATARAQTAELTQPLANVTFDTGMKRLDAADSEQLRGVAAWAHDHPWRLLVVQAYADHAAGSAANLALSQDRGDAVRSALIELGVAPNRIVIAAYGEDDPAAGRHVLVRGTLGDFRELIELQYERHTPAPRAPSQRLPTS